MANLILYYSRKGENYVSGSIQTLKKGNTERVAEYIQKAVGGELFEIEPVRTYSESFMTCIQEAKSELQSGARPAVRNMPENLDAYDTVFIGYPNWWGTMPMFMLTVLEALDWTGKKVVPFCTNEGSGMGSSERDIRKACRGATVLSCLSVQGGSVGSSEKQVTAWAEKSIRTR